ncbi:MAG: FMN-binding negative transcriptional regulator, partial [Pseudomonadota bacterium]
MHPNPIFRKEERARHIALAQSRAFGMLTINADPAPLLAHIPFQISDDGTSLDAHLVRSNPIARKLRHRPCAAILAVQGPDAYISPDWYKVEDQVPTWNYAAVHLHGRVELLPDEALRTVLEHLSDSMEKRLLPKPIWKMDKVDDTAMAKMMRQIVPIAMQVDDIDGTWKL